MKLQLSALAHWFNIIPVRFLRNVLLLLQLCGKPKPSQNRELRNFSGDERGASVYWVLTIASAFPRCHSMYSHNIPHETSSYALINDRNILRNVSVLSSYFSAAMIQHCDKVAYRRKILFGFQFRRVRNPSWQQTADNAAGTEAESLHLDP